MVVGFHITNEGIVTSDGVIERDHPLTFLLDYKPNDVKVFYDLDASVASLLHLIEFTPEEGKQLYETEQIFFSPWSLKYFPERMFIIKRSHENEAIFYNMGRDDYLVTHYTDDNSIEDAINKAKEAKALADQVQLVHKSLGMEGKKLGSPIAEFLDRKNLMNIPSHSDIPDEVNELADQVYIGNWTEAYKLGHFKNTRDYDINGSYGYELSRLLDIRRGKWLHDKTRPDNALYGFAHGLLTTDADFHPFIYSIKDTKEERTYTPSGTYEITLTLEALDLLYKYKLGTFEIKDAWWWTPNDKPYHVLQGVVSWLWERRQGKIGIEKTIIQRIYSGLWGQMQYTKTRRGIEIAGKLYNPPYAAIVSQNSTLHVANACFSNGIIPLAINADGFITDQNIELPISTKLGDWKLSSTGDCIIFNRAVVAHSGKYSEAELAFNYYWLYDQIETKPKASEYIRYAYSPVTLAESLLKDFNKLGTIEKIHTTVNIGDNTRYWLDKPKNGIELLNKSCDSEPKLFSYIQSKTEYFKRG